ncbi:MATE family efflux transporter [Geobacter anodireducens]
MLCRPDPRSHPATPGPARRARGDRLFLQHHVQRGGHLLRRPHLHQALAALSLSFPLFFIVLALGAGTSMGATALIGHALGSGNREDAELYAAQAVSFGVLHALLLTAAGLVASPAIFRLMGASGDYLALALAT